jgi:hypothetical protein
MNNDNNLTELLEKYKIYKENYKKHKNILEICSNLFKQEFSKYMKNNNIKNNVKKTAENIRQSTNNKDNINNTDDKNNNSTNINLNINKELNNIMDFNIKYLKTTPKYKNYNTNNNNATQIPIDNSESINNKENKNNIKNNGFYKSNNQNNNQNNKKITEDIKIIEDINFLIFIKDLYKKIIIKTHPDRSKNDNFNKLFIKAQKAYENNDYIKLLLIGYIININIPRNINISLLNNIILKLENNIKFYKSSISLFLKSPEWIWFHSSSIMKKKIEKEFIKKFDQ